MKTSTKQKIIEASIDLFNRNGLVNVRLQHIADAAGISVGNLAYHFYSKTAIVKTIDEELSAKITPILSNPQNFPNLIDFNNQLSLYFGLFKQYAFYFLDLIELERAYPDLHAKRQQYFDQMIRQIETWIKGKVEEGLLQPETAPSHYSKVAISVWMIITFWIHQQLLLGKPGRDEQAFKLVVWTQLVPYFTEVGRAEYELLILPMLEQT